MYTIEALEYLLGCLYHILFEYTVSIYTKGPMGRSWCWIYPVLVLGVGRMGLAVTRINIYLRWGRGVG